MTKDQGGHESHGGRDDLGAAREGQLPHVGLSEEIAFIHKLAEDKRGHLRARIESVNVWLDGTEESHKAAHRLAESMAGRKLPYKNKRERKQLAQIDERIGNIYAHEIALLERVERVLVKQLNFDIELVEQLKYVARSCPCGARSESLDTHPHMPGCPIAAVVGHDRSILDSEAGG